MSPPGGKYIDSASLQVFPPPSLCQDVTQYIFFIKGQQAKLQQLCDKFLNEPSGGAVHYRPRLPFVMLTFQHVGRLSSGAEGFQDRGHTSEHEATFWVPVSDYKKHGADELCKKVELFIPFIYADNPWAVAGGREIYGFPKQAATVHMPGGEQDTGHFEIRTLAYRTFSKDSVAHVSRLLTVERADGAPLEHGEAGFALGEELLHSLGALRDELGQLVDFNFEVGARIIEYLFRPSIPMVFLKQFREVGSATGACYQAIVGAEADQLQLKSLRLLPRRFRLKVETLASQPLAETLGLELDARGQLIIPGGLQIQFDFRLNEGHLIWSSS
jgi:hypothetical protein